MLDRTKIAKELALRIDGLGDAVAQQRLSARELWRTIAYDEQFCERAWATPQRFSIPSWTGLLGETFGINTITDYDVLAVDGSQIYPDRHQGVDCFLINTGVVHLHYGDRSSVQFESVPTLNMGGDGGMGDAPETINAVRTEYELQRGLAWMDDLQKDSKLSKASILCLLDGSLIFWHLQLIDNQGEQAAQKNEFLSRYCALLDDFHARGHMIAAYISLPKSRELINLLRIAALDAGKTDEFPYLVDSDVAAFYLKPGERSVLFKNHSPVTVHYPDHSVPYFFYLNTGAEIARVELPAWIACDEQKLTAVQAMIYDQVLKGQGYPVALAEAHEQAVVTNVDRDFFYYLMHTMLRGQTSSDDTAFQLSQKLAKKRRAAI